MSQPEQSPEVKQIENNPENLMEELKLRLNELAKFMYDERKKCGGGEIRKLLPFILGHPFLKPYEDEFSDTAKTIFMLSRRIDDIKFNLTLHAIGDVQNKEKGE